VILLARHGETDDNREPIRIQGFRDTPLNDAGRAQAHELAERVECKQIGALYSSDLSRACETAEIVGAHIGLQPRLDPRLREGSRGIWEGRCWYEVEREDPESYAAWRRAGASFRFPGGESLGEQLRRVVEALGEIGSADRQPGLAVCHGGSIRVALCHANGDLALQRFHSWTIPNAALIEL